MLRNIENHTRACELFGKASTLGPDAARYHAEKARSLVALSKREDALAEAELASLIGKSSPRTQDTIGVVFSRLGLHERAVPFYRDATSREPGSASYWYNLGAALQFMGDFAEAETAYSRSITIDPRNVRAWSAMVLMKRQTVKMNHKAVLEALFDTLTDADDQLHIGHALAKTSEDLSDPDGAMAWLDRAKTLHPASRCRRELRQAGSDAAAGAAGRTGDRLRDARRSALQLRLRRDDRGHRRQAVPVGRRHGRRLFRP